MSGSLLPPLLHHRVLHAGDGCTRAHVCMREREGGGPGDAERERARERGVVYLLFSSTNVCGKNVYTKVRA